MRVRFALVGEGDQGLQIPTGEGREGVPIGGDIQLLPAIGPVERYVEVGSLASPPGVPPRSLENGVFFRIGAEADRDEPRFSGEGPLEKILTALRLFAIPGEMSALKDPLFFHPAGS